jgi:orotidine-5'-phosphate decarboxylase
MTKTIPTHERLIVALDVPDATKAWALVEHLSDSVSFYKVGLELFMAGGYIELVRWLKEQNKKVFIDLKFFDVPQTVKSAVKQACSYGADFVTVHGNDAILKGAIEGLEPGNPLKVLAVTVLTSLDQGDLQDLGFQADVRSIVLSRARRALALGCAGVISSGLEAPDLRSELGDRFLVITPGIRPVHNTDDQKRTVDVEQAFHNGADYIVMGRPIRAAEGFASPREAALDVQRRIAAVFGDKK